MVISSVVCTYSISILLLLNVHEFCRFNDDSVLIGHPETSEAKTSTSKPSTPTPSTSKASTPTPSTSKAFVGESKPHDTFSESSEGVSSNADSDFIDVPEMDSSVDESFYERAKEPLPSPLKFHDSPRAHPNGNGSVQVFFKANELGDMNDDIFADVFKIKLKQFENSNSVESAPVAQPPPSITLPEVIQIADDDEQQTSSHNENKQEITEQPIALLKPISLPAKDDTKMKSILTDLDNEMASIKTLNLNDIVSSVRGTSTEKSTSKSIGLNESTPPKIPQPFFVNKTPPSSKKKSSPETGSHLTPSKVVKSLADTFESMPSTSAGVSRVSEQETVRMAADVLRQKKSKEELEQIADHLNQERQDLIAERNKKDRLGVSITEQMSAECMDLLRLFGIPYVIAPMEAEAQCAYLNEINLTDGTITDDSDIWLFGGKTVYKNFFDSNKLVMEFKSNNIEQLFHLNRPKLIQLSFLVGSDYTQGTWAYEYSNLAAFSYIGNICLCSIGIHGIGAVTALEVLSTFNMTPEKVGETTETVSILSSLRKFRDWWQSKSPIQRATTLRNKLKNITITEDFPNPRVRHRCFIFFIIVTNLTATYRCL